MNLPTGTGAGLSAQYFNSADLNPDTVGLTRIDKNLDFYWQKGSPDSSISNTNFSARWSGQIEAQSTESYTFKTISDDGIRLFINGKSLIDDWNDHGAKEDQGTIALIAGQKYDIKMEYYQRGGDATAKLTWEADGIPQEIIPQSQLYSNDISAPNPIAIVPIVSPVQIGDGLTAQYFNDKNLGAIALTRVDPTVNFDWQRGSPDPLVNNDGFSARWTGQVQAKYSEAYTFSTTSDDGVRLWVDGKPLIDDWIDHAPKSDTGTIVMVAGQKYSIKLEYYENMGGAVSKLAWSSDHQSQEVIPQSQLFSGIPSTIPDPIVIPLPAPIAIVPIVFPPVQNSFDYAFHDSDRGVPNDAHPAGVPHNYSWYESTAQPGWGNNPRTDWHAATALGAVYAVEGWNPQSAPNTRVQLRDDQLWLLLKSSGKWTEAQYPTIQGGAFRSDFAGNAGKEVTTKDESANGGGISVTADQFYNFHFWSGQRANIDPNDIKGVYSVFQARLVLDDLTKPDDRASAHYLAGGGGDYWASQDAGWLPDWSANGGINGGRMKFVTNNFQSFSMETLSADQMTANPPPLDLVSY